MTDTSASSALPSPAPSARRGHLTLWERAAFATAHAVVASLLYVLSLPGLYRCGRFFGTLEWSVNYKRRRRFAAALRSVLGRAPTAAERRRETRAFFMRSRCDKLFYLVFDCVPRVPARALLTIENQALLDDALARGRGVYLAMSHHGAGHVLAMLLALRGYKTAAVRDRREGALRRYVQKRLDERDPAYARTRWFFANSYPREIYRCLRQGYVLGSAMDVSRVRSVRQQTEEVTVLGQQRSFLTGPLRIAIRCRAPVLQAFVTPEPNFRYRLEIVDTLVDPDRAGDEAAAVREAIRAYAANVERHLRATPSLISRV